MIDFIGNIGRTKEAKGKNDAVRTLFSDTIKGMFGVSDMEDLPDSVKAAMKLNDYGKGKPLTARRIRAVQTAVDQYLASVAQEVGVPADDSFKDLFRQVQLACHDDKVALSIVTANIKPILIDSSRNLRSVADIQAKVADIVASCDELRQVANGNQAVLVAGKMCLIAQNGKALTGRRVRWRARWHWRCRNARIPWVASIRRP